MIPVIRPDLADETWNAWRLRTRELMDELIRTYQRGTTVDINDAFYKEAKPFLLRLFYGKCAYCEAVISTNQPGDVEHYRPKGRIRTGTDVVKWTVNGAEVEHPGYWWLAYDWRNLLPSCIDCNRRRRHGDEDLSAGKAEYFEIRGSRAMMPGDDLEQEQALLLDPTAEGFAPDVHFEFNEDGTLKPLSDEARYSCELLGLNLRERLVSQRSQAYLNAQQAFVMFMNVASLVATNRAAPEVLARERDLINEMWEGRSQYSAFSRRALDAVRNRLHRKTGVRIDLPLP